MQLIKKAGNYILKCLFLSKEMKPGKAYNLWSENYDNQQDNPVIALDEKLFNLLSENIVVTDKVILDIGCGTGRHWKSISGKRPGKLIGYDVSKGMLRQLQKKFPEAETHLLKSSQLYATDDMSCDLIISTLTIGYIPGLESAFREWNRVLKPGADIIITDFHPRALAMGGKRTFSWNKRSVEITNYIYTIEQVEEMARKQQWYICNLVEMPIDDSVKQYFEKSKSLHVFERTKGNLIIYGIHLKKTDATVKR